MSTHTPTLIVSTLFDGSIQIEPNPQHDEGQEVFLELLESLDANESGELFSVNAFGDVNEQLIPEDHGDPNLGAVALRCERREFDEWVYEYIASFPGVTLNIKPTNLGL